MVVDRRIEKRTTKVTTLDDDDDADYDQVRYKHLGVLLRLTYDN